MKKAKLFAGLLCVAVTLCLGVSLARGQQREEVAITVDDLPTHGDLPPGVTRLEIVQRFLVAFKAKHLPPVYGFINAKRAEGDAAENDVLKAWVASGNFLGNHTAAHPNLTTTSVEEFEAGIAANEAPLRALMGQKDWHWFRYPFLHEGETLEKRHAIREYLREHGYRLAQVTLDFEDYAWNNPYARCLQKNDQRAIAWLKSSYISTAAEYIAMDQKVAQQVYGRSIKHVLLLHIGAFDSIMLPELLDFLQAQGFRFVSLEEAEADPAYQRDPDAALKYGGSLLDQFMDSQHLTYPPHADKPMDKLSAICR